MVVLFCHLKNTMLHLGFIVLIATLVSAQVDAKKCLARNGLFPKPGSSCKAYYRCKNWIPVEEICPPDLHFNAIKGWCDWMELYPCLEKPKHKECPRENGLFLKPGTNCKKYYDCCNGEPKLKECPQDQLFDPLNEKCEWPELYTCVEKPNHKECLRKNGRFSKPGTNCKKYYDCCNGEPKEKECPQDQLFDPLNEKCEWPEIYTCVESLSTIETSPKTLSTILGILTSITSDNKDFHTSEKISQSPVSFVTTTSWISDTSISSRFVSTDQHDLDSSSNPPFEYSSTSVPSSTRITTLSTTPEEKISTSTIDHSVNTFNIRSSENPRSSVLTTTPGSSSSSTKADYFTGTNKIDESTIDKGLSTLTASVINKEVRTSLGILEVTTPETLNILCPEPNGYFPHPTNKHKFVGCVDNIPSVLTCPHDLVYRHELRQCDYQ